MGNRAMTLPLVDKDQHNRLRGALYEMGFHVEKAKNIEGNTRITVFSGKSYCLCCKEPISDKQFNAHKRCEKCQYDKCWSLSLFEFVGHHDYINRVLQYFGVSYSYKYE